MSAGTLPMSWTFNPFTSSFDQKGSGGGTPASAFFAGEVATYAELPLDGTAALNSRWLVRSNSGTWPFASYKQAGIYIRTATGGTDRTADYTLTDTSFHDVMSDAAFLLFDNADPTRSMQVEITDNETLSFKVTGTDSVVRSVAFALSSLVVAAVMLTSSALAQNIGLVTDTNGNVITRRTNALTFTNGIAGLGTAATNGQLWSDGGLVKTTNVVGVPSGAAAFGAVLQSDGANGSSFEGYRIVVTKTNSTTRTNLAITSTNAADDPELSVSLPAGSHRLEGVLRVTTTDGVRVSLYFSNTIPSAAGFGAYPQSTGTLSPWATASAQLRTMGSSAGSFNDIVFISGIVALTNTDTIAVRWAQFGATTNATTVLAGSTLTITSLSQ